MEEELQQQRYYLLPVKKMRLLLMMGAILYTYGTFSGFGDLNGVVFGFIFPSLYIISGYVVLWESDDTEKRILRAIRRTAICFVILAICYFGLSFAFEPSNTLATVSSKSFWVNFLLFNIWSLPIGTTIWFVQALLYAYIIIYVIYKLKLLKLDIFLAVLCLAVTVLTGELSSVVGFSLLGHTYLGGNFLTRALPYILIGCFIQRKEEFFVTHLNSINHIGIFVAGIILTIGEYFALTLTGNKVYVGHLFGMGIVAVAFCLFILLVSETGMQSVLLGSLTRYEMMIPFYVCSPIYYLTVTLLKLNKGLFEYLGSFAGIITLMFSIAVLYLYAYLRFVLYLIIHRNDPKLDSEYMI